MKRLPSKKIRSKSPWLFSVIRVGLLFAIIFTMGCKTIQCAPALSCEAQPVEQAVYPKIWTSGKYDSFRLVVTNGPYRLKESSIARLKKDIREKTGLSIEVVEGIATGLPVNQKAQHNDILAAGLRQVPSSDKPVIVVVVVNGVKGVDYNYKGIVYFSQSQLRKLAREKDILLPEDLSREGNYFGVLVLNRGHLLVRCVEDLVLIHEIGHWLGVPARQFHTSCDQAHCTNGRCLMFAGKIDFPTAIRLIGVNLLGPTSQYGPACTEELAEMQRQRQVNRQNLKTQTK